VVPYNATPLRWALTDLSVSYVPERTSISGKPSALFAHLNAVAPPAVWKAEFARALQTWANYSPLNFHFVGDNGAASNAWGLVQGDSRFGDIRLGAIPLPGALAATVFPSTQGASQGGTNPGDITLSTRYRFRIGANYDLHSVLLHEVGHALGLGHSSAGTVMYGAYTRIKAGLSADDIAGIRAMYGARTPDSYDAAAPNDSPEAASPLTLISDTARFRADLTSQADVDYYRVAARAETLTVSVDARGLSLLAPRVLVYESSGTLLGSAAAPYGQTATLTLSGLTPGQTYILAADGATTNVFGMGAYVLDVAFDGDAPAGPPAPPSNLRGTAASTSKIELTWQDNAANETGFRVERSSDGVTFTPAGTAAANATQFVATGLSTGTTYYFRALATATEGDSAWSAVVPVTTLTVSADALEFNNLLQTATNLRTTNRFNRLDLSIHSGSDLDHFTFRPRTSGRFLIQTEFVHAAGNLDLYFYNRSGELLASSTSLGDGESLTQKLTGGRRYYVGVASPEGDINTFDLSMARAGTGGGDGLAPLPSAPSHPRAPGPDSGPHHARLKDGFPFAGILPDQPTARGVEPVGGHAARPRPAGSGPGLDTVAAGPTGRPGEVLPAPATVSRQLSVLDEVFAQFFTLPHDPLSEG
jgi:hypothetical protein